jgi:hypothetical protein
MTKNYPVRREHPRFNVDIRVGVTVADEKFDARTRDMSRAGLCLVVACAACVRYQPRPLDPATHTAEVFRRDLSDSALVAAVTRYAGRPQEDRWTDRQLAVAGLTLRSDLRRLRAQWRAASAAERTAGERPGVGVQGEVERRVGGREVEDPWVVGVRAVVQIELGGKRGARVRRSSPPR